jgi:hypothetical protein
MDELDEYPWSGHRVIREQLKKGKADAEELLNCIGKEWYVPFSVGDVL